MQNARDKELKQSLFQLGNLSPYSSKILSHIKKHIKTLDKQKNLYYILHMEYLRREDADSNKCAG